VARRWLPALASQDVLYLQAAILEARDIYKPVGLDEQLLHSEGIDVRGCGACG
jgi:hypothetical protein